jgi:hypothetical protein
MQKIVLDDLRFLLMDYDLKRGQDDDPLVPPSSSDLWERLPQKHAESCRLLAARYYDIREKPEESIIPISHFPDMGEIRVGRHTMVVSPRAVAALDARWSPSAELEADEDAKMSCIVHVLALYNVYENPLQSNLVKRCCLQMGLDPELRVGYGYELFASPMNAAVENGKYLSKFPYVEKHFGSIGRYSESLDAIPEGSEVFVNPPWTDDYLNHVFNEASLDDLQRRFKIRLVAPVRESAFRKVLVERFSKGSCFVKRFWDSTSGCFKDCANPVLFWHDPALPAEGMEAATKEAVFGGA